MFLRNNVVTNIITLELWIDRDDVTLFCYDHSLSSIKQRIFEEAWNAGGTTLWFPKLKPSMENMALGYGSPKLELSMENAISCSMWTV